MHTDLAGFDLRKRVLFETFAERSEALGHVDDVTAGPGTFPLHVSLRGFPVAGGDDVAAAVLLTGGQEVAAPNQ